MTKIILRMIALFSLVVYVFTAAASVIMQEKSYREAKSSLPEELSAAESTPFLESAASSQAQYLDSLGDIGFEISPLTVKQGGFVTVTASGVTPLEISFSSPFDVLPVWTSVGERLTSLIPIKYTFEPGEYVVEISGGSRSETFLITVTDGDFETQYLTVDESITSSTVDSAEANREYFEKAQPVKAVSTAEVLWSGDFIMPLEGEITTSFGSNRVVNGTPSDRHGGIDIAAERGTPVKAANSGKVIFAEYLQLTGNTICIEHGMGLKTWYYHMDSLSVKEGSLAEKGQTVGTVGSTGFSTGPHLHFAAAIGSVYIDPFLIVGSEVL